jgi:hypothetical protein
MCVLEPRALIFFVLVMQKDEKRITVDVVQSASQLPKCINEK